MTTKVTLPSQFLPIPREVAKGRTAITWPQGGMLMGRRNILMGFKSSVPNKLDSAARSGLCLFYSLLVLSPPTCPAYLYLGAVHCPFTVSSFWFLFAGAPLDSPFCTWPLMGTFLLWRLETHSFRSPVCPPPPQLTPPSCLLSHLLRSPSN